MVGQSEVENKEMEHGMNHEDVWRRVHSNEIRRVWTSLKDTSS